MSRIHFSNYEVFKTFSKKVHKTYKSLSEEEPSLPLGTVRTICAYVFGYKNDHDLKNSITSYDDDVYRLSVEHSESIIEKFKTLQGNDPTILGLKKEIDNWNYHVSMIQEALFSHNEIIEITKQLLLLSVKFHWPLTVVPNEEKFNAKLLEQFITQAKAVTGQDWKFLPTCSRRFISSFDQELVDCLYFMEQIQKDFSNPDDCDFDNWHSQFAEDVSFIPDFSTHLAHGLHSGVLIFGVEIEVPDSDEMFEETEQMIILHNHNTQTTNLIKPVIDSLVGKRTSWIAIEPIVINSIWDEDAGFNFIRGSLQEISQWTRSPKQPKSLPLMNNKSIVGRIIFNNEKADIYLPNYDNILEFMANTYEAKNEAYIESENNVCALYEGLEPTFYAMESPDVNDYDLMASGYLSYNGDHLPENFSTEPSRFVLEDGALINCPRYIRGFHEPDGSYEITNIVLDINPNESYLEHMSKQIKELNPTSMTAMAYMESTSGCYFHVVATIYSNNDIIAEESFSVYNNVTGANYDNALFGPGDALHERILCIAESHNIPFNSASLEFSYNYTNLPCDCGPLVFEGLLSDKIITSNRNSFQICVFQSGIRKPISDQDYKNLVLCVAQGLISTLSWSPLIGDLKWGIDKVLQFIAPSHKLGLYEENMKKYSQNLQTAPLVEGRLNIEGVLKVEPWEYDFTNFHSGPYIIGMAFDGPKTIREGITLNWVHMAAVTDREMWSSRDMTQELEEEINCLKNGRIPNFYKFMEKELRSILDLKQEDQIKIIFHPTDK